MRISFSYTGWLPIKTTRLSDSRSFCILQYFRIRISGLKIIYFDDYGRRVKKHKE